MHNGTYSIAEAHNKRRIEPLRDKKNDGYVFVRPIDVPTPAGGCSTQYLPSTTTPSSAHVRFCGVRASRASNEAVLGDKNGREQRRSTNSIRRCVFRRCRLGYSSVVRPRIRVNLLPRGGCVDAVRGSSQPHARCGVLERLQSRWWADH